jgi:PLD-like domain
VPRGNEGDLVEYARGALIEEIERGRRRIWLVSPYITGGVANELAAAAERSKARQRWLITELEERSVRSRVLDPKGLRRLHEAGFRVASLQNLHAKVSIVGDWGLVGSGNLTDSGLGSKDNSPEKRRRGNVELGVVLAEAQVRKAAELVENWWLAATELTLADIAQFEGLKPYPRPRTKLRKVGRSVGVVGTERLRKLLESPADADCRYWIDPNYHDRADPRWWERRGWVSDRRDVGIRAGDLIVIYLAKRNRGPAKCPAVVRALGPAKKEESFLRRERDAEAAERWPWVTRIEVIGDVPADDGVGLDLIDMSAYSLQNGPREITRDEFETLAGRLVS